MRYYAKPLSNLINQLSKLPGIGGKSAQRLAFYILGMKENDALAIAEAIIEAKKAMKYCSICGNLTDEEPCGICTDTNRNQKVICVVESPKVWLQWNAKRIQRALSCAARSNIPDGRYRS